MTVYIDPPQWPGHGLLWSHLVSDVSYEELHGFAAELGSPRRAFDRDHYDVPAFRYADAVRLGAVEVGCKELLRRLTEAGLRRPKARHLPSRSLPSPSPVGRSLPSHGPASHGFSGQSPDRCPGG